MGVVFAILGGILKWIFLILLGLLGLILVLLLIVLLTPVRYKIQWEKSTSVMEGTVIVSWLLHLISFRLEQKGKELKWVAKIGPKAIAASYPLPQKEKKPKQKKKSTESDPEKAAPMLDQPEAPPQAETAESIPQEPISSMAEEGAPSIQPSVDDVQRVEEMPPKVPAAPNSVNEPVEEPSAEKAEALPKKSWRKKVTEICWKIRRFFEKILHPIQTIRDKIRGLREKLRNLRSKWDMVKEIWNGYPQKGETVRAIKNMVVGILKAPLPKKFDVQLRFGMKDPATTGQILGYYYALAPLLFPKMKRGRRLDVEADFENPVIEVKAKCKGRFSIGSFLWPAIKALLNGHIRRLIRYVMSTLKKMKQ